MTVEEIQKKVALVAQKYELSRVYLFGSYARGPRVKTALWICLWKPPAPSGSLKRKKSGGH